MVERQEFESVAMPHLVAVYRAAVALCGRLSDADDLVQLTYLKALERFDSLKPGTSCKAWLMTIVRNAWIDQLRHRGVVGTEVPIEHDPMAEPPHQEELVWSNATDILENFSDADVIAALNELSDKQRLALFLIDVEQFTYDEVAEIMDVAAGTVKSRCGRAREALRRKLYAHARDLGLTGRRRWTT